MPCQQALLLLTLVLRLHIALLLASEANANRTTCTSHLEGAMQQYHSRVSAFASFKSRCLMRICWPNVRAHAAEHSCSLPVCRAPVQYPLLNWPCGRATACGGVIRRCLVCAAFRNNCTALWTQQHLAPNQIQHVRTHTTASKTQQIACAE
jgi:hypothetical protein